jgi:O-acetyl-ADP-ribose deacetylase (regulator of RNase III)
MHFCKGSLFTSECQTLVNSINCVGVMGAGIALEFKRRYPSMFEKYEYQCAQKAIRIGKLWLYKAPGRWILNFPTKRHWRQPSREQDIHAGLQEFVRTYKTCGIMSAAFPLLGAQHGGLDVKQSLRIMRAYLSECSIPIEIYEYDPYASDDLLPVLKRLAGKHDIEEMARAAGVRVRVMQQVVSEITLEHITQMAQLETVRGVGETALESLYQYVMNSNTTSGSETQLTLDLD